MINRKRSINIGFRVNENESKVIYSKIEKSRLSMREFILSCITNKEILIKDGGREVIIELKRIGNNLNQLAHNVNAGLIHDCSNQLEAIYEEIRRLRKEWQ